MIRVVVLYGEVPEPERYAEHIELTRREAPEATIRHGRVFFSPTGSEDVAYYTEIEFADRDAMKRSQDGMQKSAEDAAAMGISPRVYFTEIE